MAPPARGADGIREGRAAGQRQPGEDDRGPILDRQDAAVVLRVDREQIGAGADDRHVASDRWEHALAERDRTLQAGGEGDRDAAERVDLVDVVDRLAERRAGSHRVAEGGDGDDRRPGLEGADIHRCPFSRTAPRWSVMIPEGTSEF